MVRTTRKAARIDATVRIWEQILPVDRGARYTAPLEELFEKTKHGEVTGAGSQLTATREIEFVDIELRIDDDRQVIDGVIAVLARRGVPKHTQLRLRRGERTETITFGVTEAVLLRLPRLPAESDLDDLLQRIAAKLGKEFDYRGAHVQRDTELAVILFGVDAEELWARIAPIVTTHPIAQGARVVLRAGHPDGKPRELSLQI